MSKDCEDRMGEIKQQIEAGAYLVDPTAVADAIVRRLRTELPSVKVAASSFMNWSLIPRSVSFPERAPLPAPARSH